MYGNQLVLIGYRHVRKFTFFQALKPKFSYVSDNLEFVGRHILYNTRPVYLMSSLSSHNASQIRSMRVQ